MPVSKAGDLMTVREAAALLKISPVTIKRWLKQGRLRAYHVGPRAVRIKQEDIEAIVMPATGATEAKELPIAMPPIHEHPQTQQPQAGELARRQRLVATIRARRTKRVIAPMTAAQLIQAAREEGEQERERGTE